MLKYIKKSPFGFILGAAALVLVVSPEAREGARKAIVKGTAALLNFADQVKNSSLLASQNSPGLLDVPTEQASEKNDGPT
ncbi:hypothetical protein [Desulfosporosinus sp. SB140]|uniref:hypothetical protein n=1 Tax=Desulfosporosinus paludis TaxID=3115649 RepID=UPI0038904667